MNFTNKLNVIGKMSDVYNDDIFDICLLQYQINDIRIFRPTNGLWTWCSIFDMC